MRKTLINSWELRILIYLGIITLAWHLLTIFGALFGVFADIVLLIILSWILAFVLEPLVGQLIKRGVPRLWSAASVYLLVAILAVILIWIVLPTTISQLSQLAAFVPGYLPENSFLASRVEGFLNNTVANSAVLASGIASALAGVLLVFILSFYFLISRAEISKFFLDIIPEDYEDDYLFLERVINQTFASFLRVQVVLGLALGAVTLLTLVILKINFALSTAILAAILAMIPVVGSILFLIPVALAALTVSVQTAVIVLIILIIAAQLIYSILSPKLLSSALNIHPIIVLLSFVFGYRIAGVWGAIFAVPVTSALTVVGKEILKYWQQEADKI